MIHQKSSGGGYYVRSSEARWTASVGSFECPASQNLLASTLRGKRLGENLISGLEGWGFATRFQNGFQP